MSFVPWTSTYKCFGNIFVIIYYYAVEIKLYICNKIKEYKPVLNINDVGNEQYTRIQKRFHI